MALVLRTFETVDFLGSWDPSRSLLIILQWFFINMDDWRGLGGFPLLHSLSNSKRTAQGLSDDLQFPEYHLEVAFLYGEYFTQSLDLLL